jgi:ATP-dependent Clp protease ATP-binding subunit ClpC
MFERFTDRARRSVVLAQEEARMLNHNYIGTEHILLGLVREGDGVAARVLESMDISVIDIRTRVEEMVGRGEAATAGHIPFTPRAKKVLELALREALQLGHNYIGTEHILLGLVREGEGVAAQVLVALGGDLERVRQAVLQLLESYVAEPPSEQRYGEAAEGVFPDVSKEAAPTCPNCFAALDDTLAVRVVEATGTAGGDEPVAVTIAYCTRCGVALGTLS